ncbi:MAG: phosphate transporter [Desulfurococcales archaeon ex4484_42]|nr:MAG: phosphate transporter [Desulfurococcales archaeon ex4484_42]
MEYLWLILAGIAAFFVAWNNGSNNAANAIGTVVGAGALSLRRALIVAAVFDFLGAIIFGQFVSRTIMKGIVSIELISSYMTVVKGMIAALLATGIWVLISSWLRIPMSISEGIVGGVVGFGLAIGGSLIRWGTVAIIVTAWVVLPAFSALVALALYFVYERMFKSVKLLPYVVISSMFIMVFSTIFLLMVKTMKLKDILYVLTVSVGAGIVSVLFMAAYIYGYVRRKVSIDERRELIRLLLIVAAAAMAFSHGANDVANSAGPLSAVIAATSYGYIPRVVEISFTALAFAALGIAIGIVSWGHRVVETIGEKITTLTYSSAFTAQLAASLSVLILTRLGLPVSTTIAIVGSVAGVGLAKGIRAVNLKVLGRIFSAWFVAFPAVAAMAAMIYYLLTLI